MLKYLTQKLQNSAITEEVQHKKVQIDEDQDSGTESDENIEDEDMDSPSPILIGEVTSTSSPYFSDTLVDDSDILYDPHSSEEELEVINNITLLRRLPNDLPTSTTQTQCSKRKWSQVSSGDDLEDDLDEARTSRSSLSSDEEVTGLFSISSTGSVPLQFCTSPPVNVLKPGGQRLSASPPMKNLSDSISPRKKSRPSPASPSPSSSSSIVSQQQQAPSKSTSQSPSPRHHHIQRPCLDFEKMQQMKARSVTSWRHGGELSVFCW
uniref:Uncharacterized protein n=1 Tax=Cacopsylla melanoneura TaxID=428564 RepID=A0A8D9AIU4_9HEMI